MSFDRLIRAVDSWAARRNRRDVFAQIGPGAFRPRWCEWTEFLPPEAFRERCAAADVIVGHAGMGTIITAFEYGKPLLVMPRRGNLRETRNDHQIDTARRFAEQRRVTAAFDEHELVVQLDRLAELPAGERVSSYASEALLAAIRAFVEGTPTPARAPRRPVADAAGNAANATVPGRDEPAPAPLAPEPVSRS